MGTAFVGYHLKGDQFYGDHLGGQEVGEEFLESNGLGTKCMAAKKSQ